MSATSKAQLRAESRAVAMGGTDAAAVIRLEAAALETIARRLEGSEAENLGRMLTQMQRAVQQGRRVVLCGMGKSGLIARKIAATMTSLSVPAIFLHPAEAMHGDLGRVMAGDTLLALSYSGETEEIVRLLPVLSRMDVTVLSLCGCPASTLARASAAVLDVSVDREACTHRLAPTASTTAMLAVGDALAIGLSGALGTEPQDFAALHPGGQLGRRLAAVRDLMHTGDAVPVVTPEARLPEIMHEMSAKRLGMTTVQTDGRLVGVLSDGDLRRLMERDGPEAFHRTAAEVMHRRPRRVIAGMFVTDALALMEAHKITSLVVSDLSEHSPVLGVVHMHDLLVSLSASGSAVASGTSEKKLS